MTVALWGAIGSILTLYVFWLVVIKDCMSSNPKPGFPDEVKLPDLLVSMGLFIAGSVIWPFTLIFAVGFTWEWAKLSDVVIWQRKEKDDIADLEKKAKKLGFKLAPKVVKGLDDNIA